MSEKKWYQKLSSYFKRNPKPRSIQATIAVSFTVVSLFGMGLLGISLYSRFVNAMEDMMSLSMEQVLDQTAINLESYLRNMRRISDAMYYSVIKDKNLSVDTLDEEMTLLYEANKGNLISIACYTNDGELVGAAPVATEKEGLDIVNQEWFTEAVGQMENIHFSTPHVQNLFDDSSYRYYWVVSLSQAVELTHNGNSSLGVLLVDMNYSSIEQLLNKANPDNSAEYVYLMDGDGEIIYHPKQNLIYMDLYQENNLAAAHYEDGSIQEEFQGEKRLVTVKTISYTGWKIVSVAPISAYRIGVSDMRQVVMLLMLLAMLMIIILNQLVSARIAKPLQQLNESVKEWEAGNMNPEIYMGSSLEVEHLGRTLRQTLEQSRQLMSDIVIEQEEKRKSELDALQSQINPHFLYNTLDSIVWMIEGERYEDAVFMITQLASLFRISLSRGKTIISLEDEIQHAKNYMNIQKIRYKNIFSVTFAVEEDILNCCTVKLIIQPLLENAIYYGVECMDGDGEIEVAGYRKEKDIYIEVRDNGLGMPAEMVEALLIENNRVRKKGSGVGLLNVHNRIRLRFGAPYGLEIESCPDEGTTVRIHLPDIEYSIETAALLEEGKLQAQDMSDR
ncbi:MAG: sensor histidine kinase [Blautia sp.]|nr:sensor histidine kinase [Lachnoclostridium sp.]MCM1211912.1 sensor histidine kinase [Blautia sp.]